MRQFEKKNLPKFENDFKWPTFRAKNIYRKVDAKRPKNLCLSISLVDPLNVKTDTLYNIIMNIILGQSYEF